LLDTQTKRKIDAARDILVGVVPVPQSQVEQITIALIYKFMDDMDNEAVAMGGNPKYFTGDFAQFAWNKLFDPKLSGEGRLLLYQDAISKIPLNKEIPTLFRDIFKNAFLPYRNPETLKLFLKCINDFSYDHSEKLGDAFEYLLAVLGSQGDAGQFRTPRHIIDFMVELIDPQKEDSILDPACGTAGFLISAYKHIIKTNSSNYDKANDPHTFTLHGIPLNQLVVQNEKRYTGDKLNPDQRTFIHKHIEGYDISPEMVRLSLVNMYLHGFTTPEILPYDTLTQLEHWNEYFNVILANPPFMTPKGGIRPHQKFTIQAKRSEVLFVDYILEHLSTGGKAGIIVPEGIIFQSGKAYKQLRKMLVEENYLVGVISLPGGVFNPYSGVKTSILWIDKALAKKSDRIIFLKVNNDGFDLGAQRRPIDANDLPAAFANARDFKKSLLSGAEYQAPEKDVIVVEKTRLAEGGDYKLSGERYVRVVTTCSKYPIVSLSEVAEIISGQSPDGTYYNIDGKGLPFFQGKSEFTEMYLGPPTKWTTQVTKTAIKNDIVMSVRAPVGPVNIVKSEICIGRGLASIRCLESINYLYCFYMLRSIEPQINGNTGSTFASINRNDICKLKIPLPPLTVQEEIVAELDSYQKIIDGAKQVVDNWKPKIDIDPEWAIAKLRDVCQVNPESRDPSELYSDWFNYLDITSIDNASNTLSQVHQLSVSIAPSRARRIVKLHDVIISTVRPNLKAFYYFDSLPERAIVSTGFAVLRAKGTMHPKYIYYCLLSEFMVSQMESRMGKGAYPSINQSDVNELNIPIPEVNVQQAIVNRIESEQKLIDANRELIRIYEQKIKDRIERLWKS